MFSFKYFFGAASAIFYAYLRYNVDGYWWLIPFFVLMGCLAIK